MSLFTVVISPVSSEITADLVSSFVNSIDSCPRLATCSGAVHKKAFLNFSSESQAAIAASALNGVLFCGVKLVAQMKLPVSPDKTDGKIQGTPSRTGLIPADQTVIISPVDPSLLNENLRRGLSDNLPNPFDMTTIISVSGDRRGKLFVNFNSSEAASSASTFLDGCMFLGSKVKAEVKGSNSVGTSVKKVAVALSKMSFPSEPSVDAESADEAVVSSNLCELLTGCGYGNKVDADYRSAGVLLYRYQPEQQRTDVLLGAERSSSYKLSLLGGKRGAGETVAATAVRELYEESGGQLSDPVRRSLLQILERGNWDANSGVQACWLPAGKYVLYLVSVDDVPGLRADTDDICQRFGAFISHAPRSGKKSSGAIISDCYCEMRALEWVNTTRLLTAGSTRKDFNPWSIIVFQSPIMKLWLQDTITRIKIEAKARMITDLTSLAVKEKTAALKAREKTQKKILAVTASLPVVLESDIPAVTDLIVVSAGSAEYTTALSSLTSPLSYPAVCVKKCVVNERRKRFDAYRLHNLPVGHQQVRTAFHGTPQVSSANSIARNGPDFTRAGSNAGTALGAGFYTSTESEYPESIAKSDGALLVLSVAPGRMFVGNGSVSALADSGHDSVTTKAAYPWHVLFHPDAVCVEYIIDHGTDSDGASQEQILHHQAYLKATAERDLKEIQREMELVKYQSQQAMCDYFTAVCEKISTGVPALTDININYLQRKFDIERQQFEQKLPMYARKGQFLHLLRHHQAVVLKGGTGIGKTVTVPQWCYDDILCAEDAAGASTIAVAVLVPRKAIAEGLAAYIAKVRNVRVGEEVGLGTGDYCKLGPNSRISFFTYGFFAAITKNDKYFSQYGIVILDEAHERNPDADELLLRLSYACGNRPEFKMVVMSATIDVSIFAKSVQFGIDSQKAASATFPPPVASLAQYTGSCPVIEVPGVTFPVEDIWWNGQPWDPSAESAHQSLCIETLRVFTHEGTGNILVFLSTVRSVDECVALMSTLLAHDKYTSVLPLYARLDDWERERVVSFCAAPANAHRRMICFSTNVAEAGVTIPGISAVIETGREMNMTYDFELKATIGKIDWISQASQRQRRGRAGRTAPGRCYCMYSEADFLNSMPEFSVPAVLKMNCESFYLGLAMSGGGDPCDLPLIDNPRERMEAARDTLVRLGAITLNPVSVTELGKAVNTLPLDIYMSKCILMAATLDCAEPMIIIACIAQVSDRQSLFTGSMEGQKEAQLKFSNESECSGDLTLNLAVYEQWAANDRSNAWCTENHVCEQVLKAADALLVKVHKTLARTEIPFSYPDPSLERARRIDLSICCGYADNVAVANSPDAPGGGFRLMSGYNTNPVTAQLHKKCVIEKTTKGVNTIVFHKKQIGKGGGHFLLGVTVVDTDLLLEAQELTLGAEEFRQFKEDLKGMEHTKSVCDYAGPLKQFEVDAFHANIKDVKREFPLAVVKPKNAEVKKSKTYSMTVEVSCPPTLTRLIKSRLDTAHRCARERAHTFTGLQDIAQWVQRKENSLTVEAQELRREARERFGAGVADKSIQIVGDFAAGTLVVTSLSVVLDDIVRYLWSPLMGGVPLPPPAPIPTPAPLIGGFASLSLPGAGGSGISTRSVADEATRYGLLFAASTTRDAMLQVFGGGLSGTMMVMAHHITFQTNCWVYGGFCRDFLVNGIEHSEMDLDIGLPKDQSISPDAAFGAFLSWAQAVKLHLTYRRNKGPLVIEATFKSFDGTASVSVEFVDSVAFARSEPAPARVDFDVNNLKVQASADKSSACLALKYEGQGGSVETIRRNIQQKQLCLVKKPNEITARIEKMRNRGWKIVF